MNYLLLAIDVAVILLLASALVYRPAKRPKPLPPPADSSMRRWR
jgi:hypothetical protein